MQPLSCVWVSIALKYICKVSYRSGSNCTRGRQMDNTTQKQMGLNVNIKLYITQSKHISYLTTKL